MATRKQIQAAKRNVKKAQKKWKNMSHKERCKAMPGGKGPIKYRK